MHTIEKIYELYANSTGISIDTRTMIDGNLFFAISGERFNANKFAKNALEKGASYAIIDDVAYLDDQRMLLVENALETLQQLAVYHRDKLTIPVIGITGSNGKTTTKELIFSVLQKKYKTQATKGNYNNHIGVPLTILAIEKDIEIAIVEMGANHVGEIAQLSSFAKPTHGLITNIGHAHTEGFGGFEGVIRGKSELFDYLLKNNGVAFINLEDKVLQNMAKRFTKPVTYPNEVKLVKNQPFLEVELGGNIYKTQLIGKYNYLNIAAAVAVGRFFEISDEKIGDAVCEYLPSSGRSEIIQRKDYTIILDAYNANPDSMKVALENLSEQKTRKIAILGDINEVEDADKVHKALLKLTTELKIDKVYTVGEKIGRVSQVNHFESVEKLGEFMKNQNLENYTILLKASRTIKLEKIIAFI